MLDSINQDIERKTVSKVVGGSIVGAFAALLLLLAQGCGGSDASLTKGEFIKQANKICTQAEQERLSAAGVATRKAGLEEGEQGSKSQREEIVLAVLKPYEEMTNQIAALGAPDGDEQRVEAIVEAMEESVDNAKANPTSAMTSSAPFEEANELAQEYGLIECIA
jgi:hypothetical protein